MAIRNSAKALLVKDGRILVNRCVTQGGEVYYDLPGGGQHQFETMEEAVVREVREETGYSVRVIRFAGLAEEIYDSAEIREKYSDYSHRISHIFLVELTDEAAVSPTEMDFGQQESVWMELEKADRVKFCPEQMTGRMSQMVCGKTPFYLGCSRLDGVEQV